MQKLKCKLPEQISPTIWGANYSSLQASMRNRWQCYIMQYLRKLGFLLLEEKNFLKVTSWQILPFYKRKVKNTGFVFSWPSRLCKRYCLQIEVFSLFLFSSLYSCNWSYFNSIWKLCTVVELGIYNTRQCYFHLKFYSQYFTVLASLTTWTWKPTALTTRPTTTKQLRASFNTKYAHATRGMAKQWDCEVKGPFWV